MFNPSSTCALDAWSLPRAGSDRPGFVKLTGASDDPIYFIDNDPIELCDLCPRHPVLRQSADATELGDRYPAGLTPDRRRSPLCFGVAAGSTFAVSIGTGGIAKIRGCRRGWCSADGASFGADVGTSTRAGCCFGLNKSSAFWRVLLIRS